MASIVDVDEGGGRVIVRNPNNVGAPKVFTFDQAYGELSKFLSEIADRTIPILFDLTRCSYAILALLVVCFVVVAVFVHLFVLFNVCKCFLSFSTISWDPFHYYILLIRLAILFCCEGPGDPLTIQQTIYNKTAAPLVENVIQVC